VLSSLAVVYEALGDYPKAIEYHEQRLAIAREIGDRGVEAQVMGSLKIACYALGDYAKILEYQ
jgi:tetratricopeptide (TPR) repeat protein